MYICMYTVHPTGSLDVHILNMCMCLALFTHVYVRFTCAYTHMCFVCSSHVLQSLPVLHTRFTRFIHVWYAFASCKVCVCFACGTCLLCVSHAFVLMGVKGKKWRTDDLHTIGCSRGKYHCVSVHSPESTSPYCWANATTVLETPTSLVWWSGEKCCAISLSDPAVKLGADGVTSDPGWWEHMSPKKINAAAYYPQTDGLVNHTADTGISVGSWEWVQTGAAVNVQDLWA